MVLKCRKEYETINNLESGKQKEKEYIISDNIERELLDTCEPIKNLLFLMRNRPDYIVKIKNLIKEDKDEVNSLVELLCNQFYDNILIPSQNQNNPELSNLIYKLLEDEIISMNSATVEDFLNNNSFLGKFLTTYVKKDEFRLFFGKLLKPLILSIDNQDDDCLDLSIINIKSKLNKKEREKEKEKEKSVSNKINNKFKNMLHNFNTISIKGSERKNLNEIDEKENDKDIIKNKKNDREFPLILINANNSGKKEILKSNHKLNIYNYEEAIAYEKRSFFRIFFIFLISKDNLLNIIFFNPPLELKPLRICIFIFNYAIDLALNALFYLSKNISDKYHYTGPNRIFFSLINNLTKSIASTIVGYILLFIFTSLSQSRDTIIKIFRTQDNLLKKDKTYKVDDETKIKISNEIEKILKCLKIKIICFVIFELLLSLFFFYYVTAFCHVYKSTQTSWLLDSLSSYIISFFITLILSLILAMLYKLSVNYKINILYKISLLVYS